MKKMAMITILFLSQSVFAKVRFCSDLFTDNVYENSTIELPVIVTLKNEIQSDMPFIFLGQKYKTVGKNPDGTIRAVRYTRKMDGLDTLPNMSAKDIELGVVALAEKISIGDDVIITHHVLEGATNAKVLSIQGMYARVSYEYYSSMANYAYSGSGNAKNIDLIPLSQLRRVVQFKYP